MVTNAQFYMFGVSPTTGWSDDALRFVVTGERIPGRPEFGFDRNIGMHAHGYEAVPMLRLAPNRGRRRGGWL